jgi:hypothetical protein
MLLLSFDSVQVLARCALPARTVCAVHLLKLLQVLRWSFLALRGDFNVNLAMIEEPQKMQIRTEMLQVRTQHAVWLALRQLVKAHQHGTQTQQRFHLPDILQCTCAHMSRILHDQQPMCSTPFDFA